MRLTGRQIGFALPLHHFIIEEIYAQMSTLVQEGADVYPLLLLDEADEQRPLTLGAEQRLRAITGKEPAALESEEAGSIPAAFDLLIIAPCSSNMLTKILGAQGSPGTLAKTLYHLQSDRPVVLALVANGDSQHLLTTIAQLMRIKSIFFVPFGSIRTGNNQSLLVTRMDLLAETCIRALTNEQLSPVFWEDHWLPQ